MPFKNLIDYLEGGSSLGEFLEQFPTVSKSLAIQSLEEAKDSLIAKISRRFCWTSAFQSLSEIALGSTIVTLYVNAIREATAVLKPGSVVTIAEAAPL